MAKYVVAGKSDCPFYARAELLADELEGRLPSFKVHKIAVQPNEWDDWVTRTCSERKWEYDGKSPIIWRELLDRGGKGTLLGSCNEFLEMAKEYYGLVSLKMTEELKNIAEENKLTKNKDDAIEKARQEKSHPTRVCVSGAANEIAYHVLLALCNGEVFPTDEEIVINLFDSTESQDILSGVAMEIQDCATDQLKTVVVTDKQEVAFKDTDLVIILDGFATNIGNADDIKEYLDHSSLVFKQYGKSIDNYSRKSVKVLVAGGPVSIICKILSLSAPSVSQQNFFALSRLEENIVKSLIARRLQVKTSDVKNVVVWGQPFLNRLTDTTFSRVTGYDGAIWGPHIKGFSQSTPEMVHDDKWLANEINEQVKSRNESILDSKADGMQAISRAAAIISQLKDLIKGQDDPQEIFSLGLVSQGWYNVPEGTVFSFPVRVSKDGVEIVSSLEINEAKQTLLQNVIDIYRTATDIIAKIM